MSSRTTELKNKIADFIANNPEATLQEIAKSVGTSITSAHRYKHAIEDTNVPDDALALDDVKKAVEIQRLRDVQRVERKLFRREARTLNAANDLFEGLLTLLGSGRSAPKPVNISKATKGGTLIVQLSDLHIGETVTLPTNMVDTKIISQRLYTYIEAAIKQGRRHGVRRAVVLLTGDLINSSRRKSEELSNESHRAQAVFNAFEIISGIIDTLNTEFSVDLVTSVMGNESRIDEDFGFEHQMFLNNFDFILHKMLEAHFPSIRFSKFGNPVERIVVIDDVHLLMTHLITDAKASPQKQIEYYKQKLGNRIDYIIGGHLHEALIGPQFSRSGSVIGANCYSELSLAIAHSTPSQTFHIVEDAQIYSFPVDLSRHSNEYFAFTSPPTKKSILDVTEWA